MVVEQVDGDGAQEHGDRFLLRQVQVDHLVQAGRVVVLDQVQGARRGQLEEGQLPVSVGVTLEVSQSHPRQLNIIVILLLTLLNALFMMHILFVGSFCTLQTSLKF